MASSMMDKIRSRIPLDVSNTNHKGENELPNNLKK
jgi:hypothetical protein